MKSQVVDLPTGGGILASEIAAIRPLPHEDNAGLRKSFASRVLIVMKGDKSFTIDRESDDQARELADKLRDEWKAALEVSALRAIRVSPNLLIDRSREEDI